MAILRSRGQIVDLTESVQLTALFRDFNGNPVNLAVVPNITIIQPSGQVLLGPTMAGVYQISTGLYGYDHSVGISGPIGVYTDLWQGLLDGYTLTGQFNFMVNTTQLPAINSDGYVHLGDDPGFHYSQIAICNINNLLKSLKARLNSAGKSVGKDGYGNVIYHDCDIFSIDSLVTFLASSITLFNEVPHFTFFSFENTEIVQQFHDVIVQGALLWALASKALIERGREFNITDNGISFTPPAISELLNTQWTTELNNHWEKVKLIKGNMKPSPLGLGTLTISTSRHPAIARLRHLRARQIY